MQGSARRRRSLTSDMGTSLAVGAATEPGLCSPAPLLPERTSLVTQFRAPCRTGTAHSAEQGDSRWGMCHTFSVFAQSWATPTGPEQEESRGSCETSALRNIPQNYHDKYEDRMRHGT